MTGTTSPTMGRPKKLLPTTHVRMYEAMAEQLRTIAFHKKTDIADVLQRLFASRVKREYLNTLEEIDLKRKELREEMDS